MKVPNSRGEAPLVFPDNIMMLLVAGNEKLPNGETTSWNKKKSQQLLTFYGQESGSLNSCMELLRELFVGKDWREKGVNLYKSFRRKWSWEPKEFKREFASVCEAVGYPLRWEKEEELSYRPRSKMEEMFTPLEKDMLGKKGVDFLHDPRADDEFVRLLLEEARENVEEECGLLLK